MQQRIILAIVRISMMRQIYFLKGGCLISESCPDCSGVQIKFKDDTICVNCGKSRSVNNELRTKSDPSGIQQDEIEFSRPMTDLSKIEKMVVNRIGHLMVDLNSQNDLLNETQIAELIADVRYGLSRKLEI